MSDNNFPWQNLSVAEHLTLFWLEWSFSFQFNFCRMYPSKCSSVERIVVHDLPLFIKLNSCLELLGLPDADCTDKTWSVISGNCFSPYRFTSTVRSFIFCSHPHISLCRSSQGGRGGWGMWHAWERIENCTSLWWESPKERDVLEDRGVDGRMGSEWILGRFSGRMLAQDWGKWRTDVNSVMNLRVLAPRS
jgi:hypothetical protein